MAINVLITDDSAVMRSMIKRVLNLTGLPLANVHTAKNGNECLQILNENWVDILFLDINMPGLDGLSVLRVLSQDEDLSRLPVIVISAESNRELTKDLPSKSVRAFVGKPFTPEELRKAVLKAAGGVITGDRL